MMRFFVDKAWSSGVPLKDNLEDKEQGQAEEEKGEEGKENVKDYMEFATRTRK